MSRISRTTELWFITAAVTIVALGLWLIGSWAGSPVLKYCGFMTGATTFVPMPADAYVLVAAKSVDPWVLGVLGGLVNGLVVLVEARWVLQLSTFPVFERFRVVIGTSRYIDLVERYMFTGLLLGGLTFLPFEPFRLIAVMRRYSYPRYFIATVLGRGLRYYTLARAGSVVADLGAIQFVVWASVGVFAVGLFRSYRRVAETN